MNRFGWFMLAVFFALGILAFRSVDRRPAPDPAQTPERAENAQSGPLRVPVMGVTPRGVIDTWQQPRDDGARAHEAIDIPAPMHTPVVAAMSGRVEKLFQSEAGGTTLYVRSNDRRWLTYYAHLSGYAPGLAEGQAVAAGQQIAFVGDTGNAGQGNTHLHFALHRMRPDERWYQGTPVNPYTYLARNVVAR